MTTRIGLSGAEVTVPNPDAREYRREAVLLASSHRTGDGSLRTDFSAVKQRWTVPWKGLGTSDFSALWAELVRASHLKWEPPEGGDFTVRVMSAAWRQFGAFYAVEALLEEV